MAGDYPPPLEDMTNLLKKMHLDTSHQSIENVWPKIQSDVFEENVPNIPRKNLRHTTDKTTLVSLTPSNPILITSNESKPISNAKLDSPSKPLKPLKRGFLNAITKKIKQESKATKEDEIPFIRPTKSREQNDIPDFMRVQADPKRIALRNEIQEMLEPTKELVKDVMETTDIKNGLEDPEIMAAISEIAGNPDAMHKYKHNKKVSEFYNHLGKLMGDRINKQDNIANSKKSVLPK